MNISSAFILSLLIHCTYSGVDGPADDLYHEFVDQEESKEQNKATDGYLTLHVKKELGKGKYIKDPFERKYFVVKKTKVFYYQDKRAFEIAPAKPINIRPIDLNGYTLIAGAVEPPYSITLTPLDEEDGRTAWKFRCDTLSEFHKWVCIFNDAFKLCTDQNTKSDLLVIDASKSQINGRGGVVRNGGNDDDDDGASVIGSTIYDGGV